MPRKPRSQFSVLHRDEEPGQPGPSNSLDNPHRETPNIRRSVLRYRKMPGRADADIPLETVSDHY